MNSPSSPRRRPTTTPYGRGCREEEQCSQPNLAPSRVTLTGERSAMTMETVEITCVTVDCASPEKVAAFWNEALNWGGVAAAPDGSGAICGPRGGGIYLEFVRVP